MRAILYFAAGLGLGIAAAMILAVLLVVYDRLAIDILNRNRMVLRIWIPEDMDFSGAFDPVLSRFCRSYTLMLVKTSDFGSLCELRYRIRPKPDMDEKALLDQLRMRNGNLNIILVTAPHIFERNNRLL